MKRNYTLLVILSLILILSANVFSQNNADTRNLRGARVPEFISSLSASYCEDEGIVNIVPDVWDPACTLMIWKVSAEFAFNPDQPTWYTVSGTGQSTVLHFDPSAVPAQYKDTVRIVFSYIQSDGIGSLAVAYDFTYIYRVPSGFDFGNDTTLCPGQLPALTLDGSETGIEYILLKDGTPDDSIAGTGSSLVFSPAVAGTYTVFAKNDSSDACNSTMTGSAEVDFYPLNNPSISGPVNVCIDEILGRKYTTQPGMTNYIWSTSGGGTIVGGAGTNEITVDWTTAGGETVTVSYENANGCVPLTPTSYNLTVREKPIPALAGPTSVCITSSRTYSTAAGMSSYVWTTTAGGVISSGSGTNSITVDWSVLGPQQVSVTYIDQYGCVPVAPTITNLWVYDRPAPTITGDQDLCVGAAGVIYTTEAGMSAYNWNIPSGGTIASGAGTNQVTVNWSSVGAQTITVNYNNSDGCPALTPTVLNVTVNPLPLPTITGEDSVCLGADLNVFYTTEASMSNYNWTVSAGGIINGGQGTNQIDVSWSTSGAKIVTVTYDNTFTCSPIMPTVYNLNVYPLPIPTISGVDTVCTGVPDVIYTTESGKLNYDWQISAGGTITSGAGTRQIKVTWNTLGNNWVSINYENPTACSAISPTIYNVYAKAEPLPTIVGPSSFCLDTTSIKTYTTEGAYFSYDWIVSAGGVIQSGIGTNQITVKWYDVASESVSINYTNSGGCSAPTPTVQNVTVNPVPEPIISGPGLVCEGVTGITYTTEASMTVYNWSISTGGTITAGAGTNEITVSWTSAGARYVRVNYSNSSGCTAAVATQYDVTVNAAPAPTIIGDDTLCIGSTNVTYTTEALFSTYDWTVSGGGVITNGLPTNQIEVTWNTSGPHVVSVNYENVIGCTAATPTEYDVEILPLPIPNIIGANPSCIGTETYSTDIGMSAYAWNVSAGGTIISGAGTNEIQVAWSADGPQTVSVSYTSAGGCPAAASTIENITVNPLPSPTIIGDISVCADGANHTYTTEALMNTYTWNVSAGGTIISGSSTNEITVQWSTAGAKTVSVNYKNTFGCSAVSPTIYAVTANLLPIPTVTGSDSVCVGDVGVTYSTESSMTGYIWSISAGGTITNGAGTDEIEVTWNTAGPQNISVNYTNTNTCTAAIATVFNVEVMTLPTPTISGPATLCLGNSTYTTESGMSSYIWNISAGGSITSGAGTDEITVTWITDGAKTVSVNYTNAGGCDATLSTLKNITVYPLPSPTVTGSSTVCADGNDILYSTESGQSTYTWGVSAGGTITSGAGTDEITVKWMTDGAKIITVNYLNSDGCPATVPSVFSVTANPLPIPTITGTPLACVDDVGVAYSTESSMNGYVWSVSAGGIITNGAGTDEIEVTWNTVGPQTVSVIYTDLNLCTAAPPTTLNVAVVNLPVPTITGSNGGCLGNITTYTTEASMVNYDWNVSAGGTILSGLGTNEIIVGWSVLGAQTVDVMYETVTGCTPLSPTVKNCTITDLPTPTITGLTTPCQGTTANIYSTELGMNNYTWSVTGGTITNGDGTEQIEVTWNLDGAQTLSVNYEDLNGCSALLPTDSVINVLPAPVPTISGVNSICRGSSGVVYSTELLMSNYAWNVSAGGVITSGSATDEIEVTWNTEGSQTVSVQYTGLNTCNTITPTTYNVNVKHVDASISSNNGSTICDGDATIFTASASGGLGATNYDFYVSSVGVVPVQSGALDNYSTSTLINNDKVYVTITDLNGCQDTDTITMTVNTLPTPNLNITSSGGNTICNGDQVDFEATAGMVNYWYYINGSPIDNVANPNYSTTALSDGDQVYVRVESAQGCYGNSAPAIDMTVAPIPVASLVANPGISIIEGDNINFTASGLGDYQFLINGVEVQPFSTVDIYSSSTLVNGDTVRVNVKNVTGCTSSAYLVIEVLDALNAKTVIANPDFYCVGDIVGGTVFINNPQAGVSYELIRTSDSQNIGIGTVVGSVVSWTDVKNTALGSQEYMVEAFYSAFPAVRLEMANRVNIVEYPIPTVYSIFPTGTVTDCNGGTGYEVTLLDSEAGVTYELYKDGVPTGNTVVGTGSGISFGAQSTNGTYTIQAVNDVASCTVTMNNSFTINYASAQVVYNVSSISANGRYCEGTSGVEVLLDGSTLGNDYTLKRNGTDSITTIVGTGAALSFGLYTVEGVYTITAYDGCFVSMNGSVNIIKDTKPNIYIVSASDNGAYCAGGSGVSISLSNQQTGIDYQLLLNGSPLGSPITGTLSGAVLDFPGMYTTAGVYSVQQSNYSCVTTTVTNAIVSVIPLPKNLNVEGDTTFCESGIGTIYISSSEADVTYTMYRNGISTGISSLGNGGQLAFLVNQSGTYKFTAQRTVSSVSCPIQLSDSIIVSEILFPLVKNYTWINGSGCSDGTVITIVDSEPGVVYTIYSRATGLPLPSYSLSGDGTDISFPGIIDSNGNYYIVAERNGACPVEFTNFGDVHVTILGVATKMEVITTPSSACVGDDIYIGLKNTELNIQYDLYLNGGSSLGADTIVQTIVGDGLAKDFPVKITTEGLYYVTGTDLLGIPPCEIPMLNTVQIKFNPFPIVYNMVGSGVYCDGMSGAIVGLDGTETGVKYYLQYDNGPGFTVIDSIVASGSPINFSNVTLENDFSVYAVSPYGCRSDMNNSITVEKKFNPNTYTVSVDNTNFCGIATGGDIIISGTQKDVTYIVTNVSTSAVVSVLASTDEVTPQLLTNLPEGDYVVEATWSGDACKTILLPAPITIVKAPVPSQPINISIDDVLICEADSSYVRVNNVEVGVLYDLMKNNVLQTRIIDSATDSVRWMVDGTAGDNDDYKVYAYYNGYFSCGQTSSKVVNLQVKTPPVSYSLSPSNYSACAGDPGVSFDVGGSEANIIYELYNQSNVRVDNYVPSSGEVGNPFTFSKQFTAGSYTLVASYITGSCSSSPNATSIITQDDSSLVCFPFEAIPDTMYLNDGQVDNSMAVCYPLKGGNDIVSSLIDANLLIRLIKTWTNANGELVETKGNVELDNNEEDYFTYTRPTSKDKQPVFFGIDSVLYEIKNDIHKNRIDTAVIYIIIGDKEIVEEKVILIPNAFSPNGDGKNDKFVIAFLENQVKSDLKIFNRWGAIVYESNGIYNNDWEGIANKGVSISVGKELPVGTYFYVYNVTFIENGEKLEKRYSGFVELRR